MSQIQVEAGVEGVVEEGGVVMMVTEEVSIYLFSIPSLARNLNI